MTFADTIRPVHALLLGLAVLLIGCSSQPQQSCAADTDCAPAPPGRAELMQQARQQDEAPPPQAGSGITPPDLAARIRAAQARFAAQSKAAKSPPEDTPEPTPISPPAPHTAPSPAVNRDYTIQLGSFREQSNRQRLIEQFPDNAPLYRFRAAEFYALSYGQFPSAHAAQVQAEQLRQQGYTDLYIRRIPAMFNDQ